MLENYITLCEYNEYIMRPMLAGYYMHNMYCNPPYAKWIHMQHNHIGTVCFIGNVTEKLFSFKLTFIAKLTIFTYIIFLKIDWAADHLMKVSFKWGLISYLFGILFMQHPFNKRMTK